MIKTIYNISPVFLQNFMCSLYGYIEGKKRFGSKFNEYLNDLILSDFFSGKEIYDEQHRKLTKTLKVAKSMGIYQDLNEIDDNILEKKPFSVLKKLDILEKSDLIKLVENYQGEGEVVKTSGTTGKSLSVIRNSDFTTYQWAVWFRHRARFGVNLRDISVNFTGKPLIQPNRKSSQVWRYNASQNQYLVCMQSITADNIHGLIDFLNTIKPKFYSGYPSIIYQLTETASKFGLKIRKPNTPDVIFFGAENILDYQFSSISSWLGSEVVLTDQYGLTEANCNFSRCEHGMYHEDFEFSYIEIVDGKLNEDGSETGRLIGTTLENNLFPLLRYDTGDIATLAPSDYKCKCGRNSRVIINVEGRKDDYIITSDGRKIMRLDYLFKDTSEISEAQVIQERLGSVTIKCVKSDLFDELTFERKVKSSFEQYIDTSMKIYFEYVSSIKRSSTGKFKAVVNRLEK